MWRRIVEAIPWVLAIAAGVALAEHWQPWATIVSVMMLVSWGALIAVFVSRKRRETR